MRMMLLEKCSYYHHTKIHNEFVILRHTKHNIFVIQSLHNTTHFFETYLLATALLLFERLKLIMQGFR